MRPMFAVLALPLLPLLGSAESPTCQDPLAVERARIEAMFPDAAVVAELTGDAEAAFKVRLNRSRDDIPELMGSGTIVFSHPNLPVDLVITRQACKVGRLEISKEISARALAAVHIAHPILAAQ